MDYIVHGILQTRIVSRLSLLQGIFPTQESNPGLLHCRKILYQLSYEGSSESQKEKPDLKISALGPSLEVQCLRLHLLMPGVQIWSLVNPWSGSEDPTCLAAKKQNIKQRQYHNKFNKDFKNGPYFKNLFKTVHFAEVTQEINTPPAEKINFKITISRTHQNSLF